MKKIFSTIVTLSVVFLPVYFFSSGGVQVSHALILAALGMLLATSYIYIDRFVVVLLFLAFYIFVRESFVVFGGGAAYGVINSAFVLFSAFSVLVFYHYFENKNNISSFASALAISAVVATIAVMITGVSPLSVDESIRSTGTFNNPNQLGYFSVCLLSIANVLFLNKSSSNKIIYFIWGLSVFLAASSLSKAAMISVAAGLLVVFYTHLKDKRGLLVLMLIVPVFVGFLYDSYRDGDLLNYSFVERIRDIGKDRDDSLEERGYGALAEADFGELYWGYGAQKTADIVGHEVHSTIFSFFVTYGLIGGGIFCCLLFMWAWRIWSSFGTVGLIAICSPPMLYGVTHNGSRFTIFWLLVAFSLFVCAERRYERPVKAVIRRFSR